jgi:multiple sugar transport system permease protein
MTRIRRTLRTLPLHALLCLASLVVLFPLFWALSTSLKPETEIMAYPPRFVPRTLTLASYRYLFVSMPFLRFFLNSLLLSSATVVATIFAASLAAYVINRRRFPGREVFFVLFLVCMMLPGLTNIIPMFLLMGRLRLMNTYLAIILLYTSGNVAFSIWLLRGFFSAIPRELDEAAILDGCSPFMILRLIILPLALSGVIAAAILVFINCWNEFLVALTFTNKELMRTLTVAIYYFRTYWTVRWGEIMAASIVTITPVLVLFGVMQRQLIEGLTKGAFK